MANFTDLGREAFNLCLNSTPTCSGRELHLSLLGLTCIIGVIANGFLAVAIFQQQKNRKTRDGVLILNLVASNFISLLVNLPLETVIISRIEFLFQCESFIERFESLHFVCHFTCNFSTLFTLALISIERFDAITKLPGQIQITRKMCTVLVIGGWVASLSLSAFLKFGPFKRNCLPFCEKFLRNSSDEEQTINNSITVTLVTIWITTCCTIACTKLILTARMIRKHEQHIKDMFGPRRAISEIRFTKTCFAISLTFILLWAPYGWAVIAESILKNLASSCAIYWTQSISHTSSSLLPIVYIALDKRVKRFYGRFFRRNEIHPIASQSNS